MTHPSRRELLSLLLLPVTTTAGCVFQEGDWGTSVLIRNGMEAEVTTHVALIPESATEPVYEADLTLGRDGETKDNVRIQTEANDLRVVVEVDHPEARTFEETVKSGHDEIWIVIFEDEIKAGGSSTM